MKVIQKLYQEQPIQLLHQKILKERYRILKRNPQDSQLYQRISELVVEAFQQSLDKQWNITHRTQVSQEKRFSRRLKSPKTLE